MLIPLIKTVNSRNLKQFNNDRIQGYETAFKETEEQDLKTMFAQFTTTSLKCKQELVSEVRKMGGKHEEGTMISEKFFRVWMDVKTALTGKNRKAILSSCEFGEDTAVDTYNKALINNVHDISADQRTMLNSQFALIKADHYKIKTMRDALGKS